MDVLLTPDLEQFLAHKMSTGRYHSPSDIIQEGLHLLAARDARTMRNFVSTPDEVTTKVIAGLNDLEKGALTEANGEIELNAFFDRIKSDARIPLPVSPLSG